MKKHAETLSFRERHVNYHDRD